MALSGWDPVLCSCCYEHSIYCVLCMARTHTNNTRMAWNILPSAECVVGRRDLCTAWPTHSVENTLQHGEPAAMY